MSVIAIIPARGGSKRLPGKNTMDFFGRPMLAYSIMVALAMETVDTVYVTSDSSETLNIARKWGADTVIRPPDLAVDNHVIGKTLQHALETAEAERDCHWDWVALLQPNVPLRTAEACDEWVNKSCDSTIDGLLTVDHRAYKLGLASPWWTAEYPAGVRKQDMPQRMRENGVFYLFKAENIRKGKLFGSGRMWPTVSPMSWSLANIDDEADLNVAGALYVHNGWEDYFASLEDQLYIRKRPRPRERHVGERGRDDLPVPDVARPNPPNPLLELDRQRDGAKDSI